MMHGNHLGTELVVHSFLDYIEPLFEKSNIQRTTKVSQAQQCDI